MYASIKLSAIKNTVRFFVTSATNKTINLYLDIIRFGVSSILISFGGEYYECHSGEKEEQGWSIGGYESAFLANLVASYPFEKSKPLLNPTTYT